MTIQYNEHSIIKNTNKEYPFLLEIKSAFQNNENNKVTLDYWTNQYTRNEIIFKVRNEFKNILTNKKRSLCVNIHYERSFFNAFKLFNKQLSIQQKDSILSLKHHRLHATFLKQLYKSLINTIHNLVSLERQNREEKHLTNTFYEVNDKLLAEKIIISELHVYWDSLDKESLLERKLFRFLEDNNKISKQKSILFTKTKHPHFDRLWTPLKPDHNHHQYE